MKITVRMVGGGICAALLTLGAFAAGAEPRYDNLVDVRTIDPTIVIELRYGTPRNLTGRALYPPGTPALVRPSVAVRLVRVQNYLRPLGYRLKIWDAYRPMAVQMELWRVTQKAEFVADPLEGDGSLHTWGVAVDVTLADSKGREVAMPTGFDEFTPAARLRYSGDNPAIKMHVKALRDAMHKGGFVGEINEWWHFVASDWKKYAPIREARKISD